MSPSQALPVRPCPVLYFHRRLQKAGLLLFWAGGEWQFSKPDGAGTDREGCCWIVVWLLGRHRTGLALRGWDLCSAVCCGSLEVTMKRFWVLDMEILFVGFADSFCDAFRIIYSFCELIWRMARWRGDFGADGDGYRLIDYIKMSKSITSREMTP